MIILGDEEIKKQLGINAKKLKMKKVKMNSTKKRG